MDSGLVQSERFPLGDDCVLELLVATLLSGREGGVLELELDILVLQAAKPLVGVGDMIEACDDLRLELGLKRCKGERVLHIFVVEFAFAGRGGAGVVLFAFGPRRSGGVGAQGAAGAAAVGTTD